MTNDKILERCQRKDSYGKEEMNWLAMDWDMIDYLD